MFYKLPSQSKDDFETFLCKLEFTLNKILENNPFLVVPVGYFNTKLDQWYKNDKTSHVGSKIANLTSQFGLQRIMNQPTHILMNSSSCIDFIFTSQSNLNRLRCSFITTSELSSSDNLCKF